MGQDTTTEERELAEIYGVNDFARQVLQSQTAFVDEQLSQLQPGQTLCVHEVTSAGDTFAVSWPMHVLTPAEECDRPHRRQQYGPTPTNWRSIVDEAKARGYRS